MTPEIENFKTWEEASLWLRRHGWGTELVRQQEVLWKEKNTKEKVAPVTKEMEAPVTKVITNAPITKTVVAKPATNKSINS